MKRDGSAGVEYKSTPDAGVEMIRESKIKNVAPKKHAAVNAHTSSIFRATSLFYNVKPYG